MIIQLPAGSREPIYRQIADTIKEQVHRGILKRGDRIPPTRELAEQIRVNRTTVVLAYDELKEAGYIESHVGRGTRIVGGGNGARADRGKELNLDGFLSVGMANLTRHLPARNVASDAWADFSRLIPDQNLFPVSAFEQILTKVIRKRGAELLQYGPALGLPELRHLIAERMRRWGVDVTQDEVIVVNGAQQGMDLLFKAFIDPGDVVVVESPTYHNILPLLGFYRAHVVGVPMTADGLDLVAFRMVAAQRPPKLLYTIPNFQNPTGICTSEGHRKELLSIAEEFNVPILEDGYEEDLRTSGRSIQPIKASDRSGRVIYLGTFSKGLFPGLRIGWIVAQPALIETLGAAKFSTDYHTSLLLQGALTEFILQGHYDRHLKRVQKILGKRLQLAVAAMRKHFPAGTQWMLPDGGYSIWVALPSGVSARQVTAEAKAEGILITSGDRFFQSAEDSGSFRLSVSTVNETQIRKGIQAMGKIISRQSRARSKTTRSAGAELPHI
ncbi:MAG TPA: PLP-dependent aminotransferase family protein [Acidobacteriota bacterium]|jgi:DNA-binding transcriptional MocR family regulator|nr:PLP-dependent aminotransferase family protein [Acidobacteriota bacterium]